MNGKAEIRPDALQWPGATWQVSFNVCLLRSQYFQISSAFAHDCWEKKVLTSTTPSLHLMPMMVLQQCHGPGQWGRKEDTITTLCRSGTGMQRRVTAAEPLPTVVDRFLRVVCLEYPTIG